MIDTNVVLDLLHFDDAVARPLRLALEAGRVRCVASAATLDELQRVLAYPEFVLDEVRQAGLFARYRALSEAARTVEGCAGLPRCSDPDDQKFIELAAAVGAQGLVSKDRAVLKLRRRCASQFLIMRPDEAVRWLNGMFV
ncbi:MAG: putative toxin-antitoxin system toxin component, PIN family [Thiobacillus sp.]|nr:putative toxin-antitoxin system toxin component, PIN family [Thiobacillus sp.]MDP2253599.1 putative toxin-antitoxin system toxin component, PIN family [Thiobacillus sp.]MDP2978478.1 putative toxin-antitoxin system toxin component, PIN family [Thiobacillus sp.]